MRLTMNPKNAAVFTSGFFLWSATPGHGLQSVGLTWDPSPSPNAIGYNLYYGVASGAYTNLVSLGNVTNTTITNLVEGTTYFFAATAYSILGEESEYSNEVSYTVPAPLVRLMQRSPSGTAKMRVIELIGENGADWSLGTAGPVGLAGGAVIAVGDWLSYSPPLDYLGSDSFSFTLQDPAGSVLRGDVIVSVVRTPGASANVRSSTLDGNGTMIFVDVIPGHAYSLEFAEEPVGTNWQRLATISPDDTGVFTWIDTPPTGAPVRTYRAVEP